MTALRLIRRAVLAVLGVVLLAALWEVYKRSGPADGVQLFGTRILPRTTDGSMPHLSKVVDAFNAREVNTHEISLAAGRTVLSSVAHSAGMSLRWAGVGFIVGVAVGLLLALLMDSLRIAERALMPYVVLSQTVPLIALAPLVTGWGDGIHLGSAAWKPWMSVSLIAAYLAFFPVAVGMTRGLSSPSPVHVEYFRCTAASRWRTLTRLKLPASVSFLIPALRLAAAGAVVGTVVGEISIGLEGGIGRLIISYSEGATGDPSRVYTAVIGAAVMGLLAAALVSLVDAALWRYHRTARAS